MDNLLYTDEQVKSSTHFRVWFETIEILKRIRRRNIEHGMPSPQASLIQILHDAVVRYDKYTERRDKS